MAPEARRERADKWLGSGEETEGWTEGGGGLTKGTSDVGRGDSSDGAGGDVIIRGQGLGAVGVMLPKVGNMTDGGKDGAEVGVAAAAKANAFAADGVFLRREFKGDESRGLELGDVGGKRVETLWADKEGNIAQVKGLGIAGSSSVFTGA